MGGGRILRFDFIKFVPVDILRKQKTKFPYYFVLSTKLEKSIH